MANSNIQSNQTKQELTLALTAAGMGSWKWYPATDTSYHDAGLSRIFGLGPVARELASEQLLEYLHPDDRQTAEEFVESVLRDKKPFNNEFRIIRPDGQVRWIAEQGMPVFDEKGNVEYVTGIVADITDIKNARQQLEQEKLELSKKTEELEAELSKRSELAEKRATQLQALVTQLTTAEERERRRLAQVLHDQLQQLIVGAKYKIQSLKPKLTTRSKVEEINSIIAFLDESIQVSRNLTSELSPSILYEAGLGPAVEWLGDRFEEKYNLKIAVKSDPDFKVKTDELKVLLFSIIKELLFNVVKHSDSKEAFAELTVVDGGDITIKIADTGTGFDYEKYKARKNHAGFGLFSIEERLKAVGGNFSVATAPGDGTNIYITVPADAMKNDVSKLRISKMAVSVNEQANSKKEPSEDNCEQGRITVLLADDHKIMREGLRNILEEHGQIYVVEEAKDGLEAVNLTERLRPDIVILDVSMPRMNGIEAAGKIREKYPRIGIIGLSMHDDLVMASSMIQAGADDYLTKGGPSEKLIDTIFKLKQQYRDDE
jgi:PAS domain S-box-containing protein